jgi:hypothetical protein
MGDTLIRSGSTRQHQTAAILLVSRRRDAQPDEPIQRA